MEISDQTPDDYLSSVEDAGVQADLIALDRAMAAAMPNRRRVVWEGTFWGGTEQTIIGYGDIIQPRPKGESVQWFLAGLARQKRNYSIYLNAVRDDQYLAHAYADRLGKVKLGAASIGFTRLDLVDLAVLGELLAEADELTPPDPA
ncbi:MAG: hypothetical protein AAF531_04505 [Actinomycetota bacterium]